MDICNILRLNCARVDLFLYKNGITPIRRPRFSLIGKEYNMKCLGKQFKRYLNNSMNDKERKNYEKYLNIKKELSND